MSPIFFPILKFIPPIPMHRSKNFKSRIIIIVKYAIDNEAGLVIILL